MVRKILREMMFMGMAAIMAVALMVGIAGVVAMSVKLVPQPSDPEVTQLRVELANAREELAEFKRVYGPVLRALSSADIKLIERIQEVILDGRSDDSATRVAAAAVLASNIHSVPIDLVLGVMQVESKYNPAAVSPTKARGLMQLTGLIWRHYSQHFPDEVTPDVHDELMNVLAGTHFLADLSKKYKKEESALTHYWGGPSAVKEGKGGYARTVAQARTRCVMLVDAQ